MEYLNIFLNFAKSDLGVGLAWIMTFLSLIYAVLTAKENKRLKLSSRHTYQKGGKNTYVEKNTGGIKIK